MSDLHASCDTSTAYGALAEQHFEDNRRWIVEAPSHNLVVGSSARILYANAEARMELAKEFNAALADGRISAPVVLSRDHHDVSGVDSPWRETSNITDGSIFTADMAIQNVIGDAFRGATWVAIHNGGGTGWGESVNGGFGLVLDGSEDCNRRAASMLEWDVFNGVARRAWAGNANASTCMKRATESSFKMQATEPNWVAASVLDDLEL